MASSRRKSAASLLALSLVACGDQPSDSGPRVAPVGASGKAEAAAPLPPIRIVDLAALQQWLQEQRGKPLLVNFWATWCQPCMEEMPDLVAGTRSFRDDGGIVVGVAMECMAPGVTAVQGEAKVKKQATKLGLDFPVLVCSNGDMIEVREALQVELGALPQTVLYDAQGDLVAQHEGKMTADEFAEFAAKAQR